MKLYIQTTPNGNLEAIDVKDDPLGKGGQGAVYNIITAQYRDEYCIKIYLKDAQKSYEKIKYMVTHPPKNIKDNPSFRICWPTALVYNSSKKFVGYMMPLAFPKGHDLTILSVYQRKPLAQMKKYKKLTEWHNKYELDTQDGILNRIKMLCNVAIALHKIHDTGRYVLVDLKPENIDATGTGKVSIMDTDSIQISEGGRILHPATAFTPDYFAPEGKELKRCQRPFSLQCDYFAAAVCFYQILTGTHPYAGTVLRHPYDKCESLEECIAQGLFAYGEKSSYISFPQGFNLQQNFHNLPVEVQALFKRAFGSKSSDRPSMEEWGKVFYTIITKGVNVKSSSVKRSSAPSIPFKVTGIRFSDQAHDGSVIRAAGNKLYTDVSYLCPIVTYDVLSIAGNVDVRYKIVAPDGNEVTNNTTGRLPLTTKGTYTRELGGWGNDKKTAYKIPGEYYIELYYNNKCIFKDTFTIHSLSGSTPKPKVTAPTTTPTPSTRSSAPVKITKVTFLDTDANGNIIHDEGSKLYTDTTYLCPKIYFDVLSPCSASDLFIKITAPNGVVMTQNMSSAMSGCYRSGIDATQTGSYYRKCTGYGGDDKKVYSLAGTYRFDFYYQNSCIYTERVEIHKKGFFASPSPAASTRRSSTGGGLNNIVSKIGDWFEDHVDSFSDEGTWMIIFAVIGGLSLIAGAISTGSWLWGIVVCVIGYVVGIYVVGIGGVVFGWIMGILAWILRYIFYNLYTLLATILVVAGTIAFPTIVDYFDGFKGYTPKSFKTTTTVSQTTTYICTSHDVLNIRKEPNAKAEIVGTIIPNQAIEVYNINNGWAKVSYKGKIAYASAKYLEPLKY